MKGTTVYFKDDFGKVRKFKVKFQSIREFPAMVGQTEHIELRDVTYAIVMEITDGKKVLCVGTAYRKPGDELNWAHGENVALANCMSDYPFEFTELEVVNFLVAFGEARSEQNIVRQLKVETSENSELV